MPETKVKHQALIFSDLDGTLLDHYTYDFSEAEPAIRRLQSLGAEIVLNTSKTRDEVISLQKRMNINGAFVVENGAALIMPKDFLPEKPRGAQWQSGFWVKSFTAKRMHWSGVVKKLSSEFNGDFEAFSDMSLERVIEITGLSEEDAPLALTREYGEPLKWLSSEARRDEFIAMAKRYGAHPLLGGRFLHICGESNKGKALIWLMEEYQRQHPDWILHSIALGDGQNDVDMLEVAGTAVRIASPAHPPPELKRETRVITTKGEGPVGWREAIDQLIPPSSS